MPISIIPPRGATPKEIWEYSERTLTQTKFPFWSAVIPSEPKSYGVNEGASGYLTIQPPSGETWLIWLYVYFLNSYAGSYIEIYVKSSIDTNRIAGQKIETKYSGNDYGGDVCGRMVGVFNNTFYPVIRYVNADPDYSHTLYYIYGGFKLGTKLAKIRSLSTIREEPQVGEFRILKRISENIYLAEIDGEKAEIELLRNNEVLAIDEDTGQPVERVTEFRIKKKS